MSFCVIFLVLIISTFSFSSFDAIEDDFSFSSDIHSIASSPTPNTSLESMAQVSKKLYFKSEDSD
jgi:hypothetical protein